MNTFALGQRWVVDSEPELGLGIVTEIEGRSVNIFFQQGSCERRYAIKQSPLTRIFFSKDDVITLENGENKKVVEVIDQEGFLIYSTPDGLVPENQLASEIQLNQPYMRLLTGQIDRPNWFYLKRKLNQGYTRLWQSSLNGLLGARTTLISHQLYVANASCQLKNVRVLLADEVGLGKTIEAGLILRRLIQLERVNRALIVVPDALQIQWLVELIRKFNIIPEIYSSESFDYQYGSVHIVPLSVLSQDFSLILESDYDIAIIDEAHNVDIDSEDFLTLEKLADQLQHLVLLTATPEQLGIESHFARLKLLDPAKFSSLDTFLEQEKSYFSLNEKLQDLSRNKSDLVQEFGFPADIDDQSLLDQLLDFHGIGRIMFRNARKSVDGFPNRIACPHKLQENNWQDKYEWLAQWCKNNSDKKIFVVCHKITNVLECEQYLWTKHGIDAALFHEEQSLIERDRAAAYFADLEEGTKILICSEIGSEGRNFQFSHDLVCMDLPENPDLLEQRIGRLDRIGQLHDVNIHVPFAENSREAILFMWYQDVLDCIEKPNPAAGAIHQEFFHQLSDNSIDEDILTKAKQKSRELQINIESGRDALLELNSCRQPQADDLQAAIESFEKQSPKAIIELASDLLQFHFEETRLGAFHLTPTDKMLVPTLPGIPPEGAEVTFERDVANSREDFMFLAWDSPFVQGLWEMLQHSELGCASVAMLPSRQLPVGHCLVETCFDLITQAEVAAICRRFLPELSLRTLILDVSDNELSEAFSEDALQQAIVEVKKHIGREIIKSKKNDIPDWYGKAEKHAETKRDRYISEAIQNTNIFYEKEIKRLEHLAKINEFVSAGDVNELKYEQDKVISALKHNTNLKLSAIRIIIVTEPMN